MTGHHHLSGGACRVRRGVAPSRRWSAFLFATTLAIGGSTGAGATRAAGFDCRSARSHVEKLICADPGLSRLDDRLKSMFLKIQGETSGHDAETGALIDPIGEEQRRWREGVRDACPDAACLRKAYAARIRDVQESWSDAL